MIVYEANKTTFQEDILNGVIGNKIEDLFIKLGIKKEQRAELMSWQNSLPRMSNVLTDSRIDDNVHIAIEFQIPLTSKRVDFMVAGRNDDSDNVVVIELKQWEKCEATSRDCVVKAFTGGAEREVVHPSQQAYSYAKLIENFNESVQENNITMVPCTYLHNYLNQYSGELCHPKYKEIIDLAPVFIMQDGIKLREFLVKYVSKPSNKKLFEIIDNGKIKPSKSLQDSIGKIMNGNQEFELIDE